MLKVGWFSTARGESSRKLLKSAFNSIESGLLKARIEFVFCSRESGESDNTDLFISQVNEYKLPLVKLSVKQFASKYQQKIAVKDEILPDWRLEYDRTVMQLLKPYQVDICVLAGYMLIVGPEMCTKYDMINLHPALPTGPKGTWQEVIWNLIAENADQSGVMMHLVTPQLDRGPVITYCSYPIRGTEFDSEWEKIKGMPIDRLKREQGEKTELFLKIRHAGFIRETPLIIHTLKAFSEASIHIREKILCDSHGNPIAGYDLTEPLNAAL